MPRYIADPLPDGCPWSGWIPPNVDWCEEDLCTWIVNPADTWSNLAYVVLGIAMCWQTARSGDDRLRVFGPASIVVGVASFVYHASYTYFFQFFDFVGMFVFCFTVITANARRLGWIELGGQWRFFGIGVALSSALVPVVSQTVVPIQSLVGVLIAVILGQELAIYRGGRDITTPRYGIFFIALALLAGAAAFSFADLSRAWCDPDNHWLQGHAIWHLLTACSLYALFHFYGSLPERDPDRQSQPAA